MLLLDSFPEFSAWMRTQPMGRIFFVGAVFLLALVANRAIRLCVAGALRLSKARYETEKSIHGVASAVEMVPYSAALYFILNGFDIPGRFVPYSYGLWKSALILNITWIIYALVQPVVSMSRRNCLNDGNRVVVAWTVRIAKFMVFIVGVSTVLEHWGIRVSTLVASIGVVGMAVALGAQDMFKNIIAGITIIAEHRFNVGDIVHADAPTGVIEGIIENIGLRSTRIIKFDRAPMYVPNNTLADAAVVNITTRLFRRISMNVRVEMRTTPEQLKYIRDEIERYIIESPDFADPSEAMVQVRVDNFDSSGILFLIYCFTSSNIWTEFMASKERLLFKIKEIVAAAGAGLAISSQSVYVEKMDKALEKRALPSRTKSRGKGPKGRTRLLPGEEI
jgi:MscS family membrane protein